MASRPRHVQRLHTATEIEADTDRCLVCGAVARGTYSLDFAAGASTIDMTVPLPDAPLCGACLIAQERAMAEGTRAILVSLFVPPALVILAVLVAPLGTPVALLVIAATTLVAMRTFVGWIARRRATSSRILFLDGAGDDVLLQLRIEGDAEAPPTGYRELARERPLAVDEKNAKPRGPKVKVTAGLVLSALAAGLATLVGWFGAYPLVVFDNPTSEVTTVTIDGVKRLSLPPGGRAVLTLGYGSHRVSLASKVEHTYDIDLRFGRGMLLSHDEAQCYNVQWKGTSRVTGYDEIVRGPRVAIDDPNGVSRTTCPRSFVW